jgi:hypothetical protein
MVEITFGHGLGKNLRVSKLGRVRTKVEITLTFWVVFYSQASKINYA